MFMAITAAFISGMGALVIFGLYWKKGTTAAAYTALIFGGLASTLHMTAKQLSTYYDTLVTDNTPIVGFFANLCEAVANNALVKAVLSVNEQIFWFANMATCIILYVVVSLLTCKRKFNLERTLHRGKYAIETDRPKKDTSLAARWWSYVGIDSEFTKKDNFIAVVTVLWDLSWFALFVIATIVNLTMDISTHAWARFWHFWIWCYLIITIPVNIWFAIGGIADLRRFFKLLASASRDSRDDGSVVGHHLATENAVDEAEENTA